MHTRTHDAVAPQSLPGGSVPRAVRDHFSVTRHLLLARPPPPPSSPALMVSGAASGHRGDASRSGSFCSSPTDPARGPGAPRGRPPPACTLLLSAARGGLGARRGPLAPVSRGPARCGRRWLLITRFSRRGQWGLSCRTNGFGKGLLSYRKRPPSGSAPLPVTRRVDTACGSRGLACPTHHGLLPSGAPPALPAAAGSC